jgi:predicted NUDIX family NTP pyrophosphohydrolase
VKVSAGLLMYKLAGDGLQVLLVHPGGPFFRRKDDGAWSIPKGLVESEENPLVSARREFQEETGFEPAQENLVDLGAVHQAGGKIVHAWAFAGDCKPGEIVSNTFELEWPPDSGQRQRFPEIDRAQFFSVAEARRKLNRAQVTFLDRLCHRLGQEV